MIVVIDNGKDYSDHEIFFVEANNASERKRIDKIVEYANTEDEYGWKPCGDFEVVAEAANVRWFQGRPMTMAELVERCDSWLCGDRPDGTYGLMA